jgi:hypothetical protein
MWTSFFVAQPTGGSRGLFSVAPTPPIRPRLARPAEAGDHSARPYGDAQPTEVLHLRDARAEGRTGRAEWGTLSR